jgi:hypothetical protein
MVSDRTMSRAKKHCSEDKMKRLFVANVIAIAPFSILQADATDLTGKALAYACEGNVPDIKREKNTEEYAKFCNAYINGWDDARFGAAK